MSDKRSNAADLAALVPRITGGTDVYLIVGHPVAQVRAPESFNAIFAHLGIDAVLVPVQVAPQHLDTFVRAAFLAPNVKGLWVTIPHKSPVMEMLDACGPAARVAGAVNAVRRCADGSLEGELFDGRGFLDSLTYFGLSCHGKRVLMLGAGGAAAAIGASMVLDHTAAPTELFFFDPDTQRAQTLAERLHGAAVAATSVQVADSSDPSGFDLIVNASPLGLMPGDVMPCDVQRVGPHAALIDILMKNQPTPWVRAARSRGLVAHPGFEMMIQQTHLYLDYFGHAAAARALRADAGFVRQCIYPSELASEIRQPGRSAVFHRAAIGQPPVIHPV